MSALQLPVSHHPEAEISAEESGLTLSGAGLSSFQTDDGSIPLIPTELFQAGNDQIQQAHGADARRALLTPRGIMFPNEHLLGGARAVQLLILMVLVRDLLKTEEYLELGFLSDFKGATEPGMAAQTRNIFHRFISPIVDTSGLPLARLSAEDGRMGIDDVLFWDIRHLVRQARGKPQTKIPQATPSTTSTDRPFISRPYATAALSNKRSAWQQQASCQGQTGLFYPPINFERTDEREERELRAKKICSGCSVSKACLAYALQTKEQNGIWGGTNETERKAMLVGKKSD